MERSAATARGIHHVTAIAGDAQVNLDFYTGVLGLRLVKLTVNYDDPGTYHFYYGDGEGRPGSLLTFFPWGARAPKGRPGAGQLTVISFSVPAPSLDFWQDRLSSLGIESRRRDRPFGEKALAFRDPDGIELELVGAEDLRPGWSDGRAPAEHALRGFHSVRLSEAGTERTAALLREPLGFRPAAKDADILRFEAGEGGPGTYVEVAGRPGDGPGRMGAGAVHHVAWRAADDEAQLALRERLVEGRLNVTPVIDRTYFHSIYFREPGGVLFEVATDPPGMTVDEPIDRLGGRLRLPPWLEHERGRIERALPAVQAPGIRPAAA